MKVYAVLMKIYENDNELRGIFSSSIKAEEYIDNLICVVHPDDEIKAQALRSMLHIVEATGMYAVYQYDRPVRLYTNLDEAENSITTWEQNKGYHVIDVGACH